MVQFLSIIFFSWISSIFVEFFKSSRFSVPSCIYIYNVKGLPVFCKSERSISQRNLAVKSINVIVDQKSHQFSHLLDLHNYYRILALSGETFALCLQDHNYRYCSQTQLSMLILLRGVLYSVSSQLHVSANISAVIRLYAFLL